MSARRAAIRFSAEARFTGSSYFGWDSSRLPVGLLAACPPRPPPLGPGRVAGAALLSLSLMTVHLTHPLTIVSTVWSIAVDIILSILSSPLSAGPDHSALHDT